jgi:hypothetical protein
MASYSGANVGPGGYYTFEVNIVRESGSSRRRAQQRTAAVISAVSVAMVCVLALTAKPAPVSVSESSLGMVQDESLAVWSKDGSREYFVSPAPLLALPGFQPINAACPSALRASLFTDYLLCEKLVSEIGFFCSIHAGQRTTFLNEVAHEYPESMLKAMDFQVDPCTNFFQYACGTWQSEASIPAEQVRELRYKRGVIMIMRTTNSYSALLGQLSCRLHSHGIWCALKFVSCCREALQKPGIMQRTRLTVLSCLSCKNRIPRILITPRSTIGSNHAWICKLWKKREPRP